MKLNLRRQCSLLTGVALVWILMSPPSFACWRLVVQSAIAERSPIVVVGTVTKIDVGATKGHVQGHTRVLDYAHIKVESVDKNVLSDVKVEKGSVLRALMHTSKRGDTIVISTDLRYKVGERARWYLYLQKDGRFYINCHLQQQRPVQDKFPQNRIFGQRRITRAEWARRGFSDRSDKDAKDVPIRVEKKSR